MEMSAAKEKLGAPPYATCLMNTISSEPHTIYLNLNIVKINL